MPNSLALSKRPVAAKIVRFSGLIDVLGGGGGGMGYVDWPMPTELSHHKLHAALHRSEITECISRNELSGGAAPSREYIPNNAIIL